MPVNVVQLQPRRGHVAFGGEWDMENHRLKPLNIKTLGHFQIRLHDQTLAVDGRGKKKPLGLIKALLAFGGREVSQERLSELLWPDADGDSAQKTFDTTLYRLRRVLGLREALLLREGRLSLNPQLCWLDSWSFDSLQARFQQQMHAERPSLHELKSYSHAVFGLYHAHFLQLDCDESWYLTQRQQLQSKYIRMLDKLGQAFEVLGANELALEVYLRALETDCYLEGFYQRAMKCYKIMGLRAESLLLYQRCRTLLKSGFNLEPSAATEALRYSLLHS